MLKMIIADDELLTLEGINSCLEWTKLGIEVIGQARNGMQALELVRQLEPDILITDIKMPKLDGIELSMILRREFPNIKIIFITGYADLNYIKSAFKYDVIDYILKPVDPEELETVIMKTIGMCQLERRMEMQREELELKIKQSLPLLQEKFFILLVSGEFKKRNEILDRLSFLCLDIPTCGYYMVITINIDDYYLFRNKYSEYEKQRISFAMINTANEIINNFAKGNAFELKENELAAVIIFPPESDECIIEEKLEKIANNIKNNLNAYYNLSITIGIGEWVDRIEKVSFSYKSAMFAANQKLLLGKNTIIYVDKTKRQDEIEGPINSMTLENLFIALRLGSYEKTASIINDIFEKLNCMKPANEQYIHGVCLQLAAVINRTAVEYGNNIGEEDLSLYEMTNHLFKLETIIDLQDFILAACEKVCVNITKRQNFSSRKVIEDIKAIIYTRYSEELTISSIAKDVYLTPSYICLLFKQETGETINNFLTGVRMEKAKELLKVKADKLYEVSRKVGYNDPKYFSKIFKKYTGVNPSEYN